MVFFKAIITGSPEEPLVTDPIGNHRPPEHPPVEGGRIGVLLVNLGTPDAHDTAAVRRYLAEFLSDRRVIELTPWLWQPILRGIVLRTRPARVAEAYHKIWFNETNESPLRYYTRRQAELLGERFGDRTADSSSAGPCATAIPPSRSRSAPCINRAANASSSRRFIRSTALPPRPRSTTGCLKPSRPCAGNPAALPSALLQPSGLHRGRGADGRTTSGRGQAPPRGHPGLISRPAAGIFHKGDPYYCHCAKTTRLLRERLGLDEQQLRMTFQSRFGPKKWLQPYTAKTLKALAREGVEHLAVVMPGFAADCLETLEEMAMQNRDLFRGRAEPFDVIPCLNDSEIGMHMLHTLVAQNCPAG